MEQEACPICFQMVLVSSLEEHVNRCLENAEEAQRNAQMEKDAEMAAQLELQLQQEMEEARRVCNGLFLEQSADFGQWECCCSSNCWINSFPDQNPVDFGLPLLII